MTLWEAVRKFRVLSLTIENRKTPFCTMRLVRNVKNKGLVALRQFKLGKRWRGISGICAIMFGVRQSLLLDKDRGVSSDRR